MIQQHPALETLHRRCQSRGLWIELVALSTGGFRLRIRDGRVSGQRGIVTTEHLAQLADVNRVAQGLLVALP